METNYSLVGKEAQALSVYKKIGVFLFIIGGLGLIELSRLTIYEPKLIKEASEFSFFGFATLNWTLFEWYILGSFSSMIIGSFIFTYEYHHFSLRSAFGKSMNTLQRIALLIGLFGFLVIVLAWSGFIHSNHTLYLWLSFVGMAAGTLLYTYATYAKHTAGIKNNHVFFNSLTSRGVLGWISGIVLTLFYVQLYWFPETLEGMVRLFDPLSYLITGSKAGQWFVYGTIYTFLIFFLGIKFIYKYRHNRYQLIRTISVIFFQLVFAYAIPHILEGFNDYQGYFQKDLKNVWPLNYGFVESYQLDAMKNEGVSGTFFFFWGIILFLIVTPFLTYIVGKRWYCSWVCGCGGLAETAGDGFRQLSSKKMSAWKIERWLIHSVMVFVLLMSIGALWPYFSGGEYVISFLTITSASFSWAVVILSLLSAVGLVLLYRKRKNSWLAIGALLLVIVAGMTFYANYTGAEEVFVLKSKSIKKVYGFFVGAAFAGVIGVGFYPILGNRVWCRFGCPMAGYMGIIQRFKSRFRITTNGAQCISCGNCSTYCEQGIDVRAYAQKGENIVRASCVGCGVCSAVCPRGVLKLENGPEEGRFDANPLVVTKDGVTLNL